ncbi:hypothetical protein A6B35_32860 (plasmid) [Mesorhizobium amorphae CCNWGS0123]|nr:hypothetical protein A6B35_32860 [Mesorhizobium amorphae CCNWGS0123]
MCDEGLLIKVGYGIYRATLIDNHQRTGRWLAPNWRLERHDLSEITGLVAVARVLLGAAHPTRWASLRLLQFQRA